MKTVECWRLLFSVCAGAVWAHADGAAPAAIRTFALGETRWTEGHWARQQELCYTRTIPSVRRVIDRPGSRAAFTNFKLVAGLSQEAKGDCRWGDGDVYKYLESLCYAWAATGDAALDRELGRPGWSQALPHGRRRRLPQRPLAARRRGARGGRPRLRPAPRERL
jgi:hypothetical protein